MAALVHFPGQVGPSRKGLIERVHRIARSLARRGPGHFLGDFRHAVGVGAAHFVDQRAAGFGRDFQGPGEPQHERAVQQRIADEK